MRGLVITACNLTILTLIAGCEPDKYCVERDGARACCSSNQCNTDIFFPTNALLYEYRGVIYLETVAEDRQEADATREDLFRITIRSHCGDFLRVEYISGDDWFAKFYRIESLFNDPYYRFYGQCTFCVEGPADDCQEERYVLFWGFWILDDNEVRDRRVRAFAESIRLLE